MNTFHSAVRGSGFIEKYATTFRTIANEGHITGTFKRAFLSWIVDAEEKLAGGI